MVTVLIPTGRMTTKLVEVETPETREAEVTFPVYIKSSYKDWIARYESVNECTVVFGYHADEAEEQWVWNTVNFNYPPHFGTDYANHLPATPQEFLEAVHGAIREELRVFQERTAPMMDLCIKLSEEIPEED